MRGVRSPILSLALLESHSHACYLAVGFPAFELRGVSAQLRAGTDSGHCSSQEEDERKEADDAERYLQASNWLTFRIRHGRDSSTMETDLGS
jgi:hypothetical protein